MDSAEMIESIMSVSRSLNWVISLETTSLLPTTLAPEAGLQPGEAVGEEQVRAVHLFGALDDGGLARAPSPDEEEHDLGVGLGGQGVAEVFLQEVVDVLAHVVDHVLGYDVPVFAGGVRIVIVGGAGREVV